MNSDHYFIPCLQISQLSTINSQHSPAVIPHFENNFQLDRGARRKAHYRIKSVWAGSRPSDSETQVLRITHTWIRSHGTWQILGGMSAPVNSEGK
jgi:hypothetical protein